MVQDSLVKYVQKMQATGYDPNTIRAHLLKYGYNDAQVNEAFSYSQPHSPKTKIALTIAVFFTIAFIAISVFMFVVPQKTPSKLLDVRITNIPSTIEQGKTLSVNIELTNLGNKNRYDVPVQYEIYNTKDELVTFKSETIALETRASSSMQIPLTNIKPGKYYMKTTAGYGSEKANAASSFTITERGQIIPEPEVPVQKKEPVPEVKQPETPSEIKQPEKKCPTSCDDSNKCTNDYCSASTNYECKQDVVSNCCGNKICETDEDYNNCLADCKAPSEEVDKLFEGKTVLEKIDMIKDIANTDKEKAISYCNGIDQATYKYDCLSKVSIASRDEQVCILIEDDTTRDECYKSFSREASSKETCEKITSDSKRDQCYMEFVRKGDYSVCEKLINKYLKQGCESLSGLSDNNAPAQ